MLLPPATYSFTHAFVRKTTPVTYVLNYTVFVIAPTNKYLPYLKEPDALSSSEFPLPMAGCGACQHSSMRGVFSKPTGPGAWADDSWTMNSTCHAGAHAAHAARLIINT